MLGFINLNKPLDWTSHDCVAGVRKILKTKKVGHGGTLDPKATGVLPIAVGKATRLLPFLPENKAYHARIRFGISTSTDDLEGEVISSSQAHHLKLNDIEALLPNFVGTIQQIPPAYSAISQGGKRLYELARKGEPVVAPPRQVRIESIKVLAWHPGEFPEIELAIACGGGTYIRSIARDLGNAIATGGTLAALTRTQSCGFNLSDSINMESVNVDNFISPLIALRHLKEIKLSTFQAHRWCQGNKITPEGEIGLVCEPVIKVLEENNVFLGIGELQFGLLIPKIVVV